MKRSFFSKTLSRFFKAEQPQRKNQRSTPAIITVELLEDRTLLSAADPFANVLSELEDVTAEKNSGENNQILDSTYNSKLLTYDAGINADPNSMVAKTLDDLHGMYASDSYIARNYLENYRGYGEKYLTGNNGWYFILPTGEVYQWSASIETSIHIGNLDENYHANPELLYEAETPVGGPNELLAYQLDQQYGFSASQSIQDKNYYYDLRDNQEKYFKAGNAWYFIVPDGGVYRWYGSIENSQKIVQLDESYHEDPMKLIEAEIPDDSSVASEIGTADFFSSNVLTITPATNFSGTFNYTVIVNDGQKVGVETKTFTVTNTAPEITPIASHTLTTFHDDHDGGDDEDHHHHPNAAHVFFAAGTSQEIIEQAEAGSEGEYIIIELNAADADNDNLTYSAQIVNSTAHVLAQTYGFYYDAGVDSKNYYKNHRGADEKYFKGSTGWFYILPTGDVFRWRGSLGASELVGSVDSGYYYDPERFFNTTAAGDVDAILEIDGSKLLVDPAEEFVGNFSIKVTVSDGYNTDETTVELFVTEDDSLSNFEFPDTNRWTETVTDGAGLEQGDPTTLLWTIVPDGTFIDSFGTGASANSDLIERMDEIYGDGGGGTDITARPWFAIFQSVVDRWSEDTGLTYIYTAVDDGANLGPSNPGEAGVRADVRIGGRPIDGDSGILAFNFFPNVGDMVIDTADNFYSDTSGDSLRLRNVTAHEMGHGIGLEHVTPEDGTKLMEAFYSENYDGPQFDDVLAANRGYGDYLEKDGGNDTFETATDLDQFLVPSVPETITIDGQFDDWEFVQSYFDPADDTHDTDTTGRDGEPVYVNHPDVDLLEYKVTHDDEAFYFYFRSAGEIGRTQVGTEDGSVRAGRFYVITTIDVDDNDNTGYWLDDGGYYPTSNGYDMNAELEYYNGTFNTGNYLNHGARNESELEEAFDEQSQGNYVFGGDETQGPFPAGYVDIKPGSYDYYTQWVYHDDGTVTFVQDKGPVVLGNMDASISSDGHEIEFRAPFEGFLTDEDGNPIVDLGSIVDISFSLEASGELAPDGEWASDTGAPINGYELDTANGSAGVVDGFVTIDGQSDVDFYSFEITEPIEGQFSLSPDGEVYLSGPQFGTPVEFDASAQNDLALQLIGTDGSTVLESSNTGGIGEGESISYSFTEAGTYYLRVTGSEDTVQKYLLQTTIGEVQGNSSISGYKYDDLNQNGTRDGETGETPVIEFLPVGDVILEANDDLSTDLLDIGFTLDFYGLSFDSFYINNNGNITFDQPLFSFTPGGFPAETTMIAPFWADVDTSGVGSAEVHLARGTSIRGNQVVQIDWPGVGYYFEHTEKLNYFTLYLEDDPEGDIISFKYGDMQWTTGDTQGTNGFGSGAQIGIDSGDGENYFSLGRPETAEDLEEFIDQVFTFRLTDTGVGSLEPGIAGVTIYIDENDNGQLDSGETSVVTRSDDPSTTAVNEEGYYEFVGLDPGEYVIREVVPDGYAQSEPAEDGAHRITLLLNTDELNRNFGNYEFGSDGPKRITLDIDADDNHITEGETITIEVGIVGDPSDVDMLVNLSLSGSGTLDEDYTITTTQVLIPANSVGATIEVTAIDDSLIEATESIVIDVQAVQNGNELNGFQQVTVFIDDNDNIALSSASEPEETTQTQQLSNSPVIAPLSTSTTTNTDNEEENEEETETTNTEYASKEETDEETVDEAFALLTEDDEWV